MMDMKRPEKRERHARILTELRSGNPIRISNMANSMQVSRETVRRDLKELHDSPIVKRTYGGAVIDQFALDPAQAQFDSNMEKERQKIAAAAMRLVLPHMVVMLDGGSTTLHLARRMAAELKRITVITNSSPAAMALATCPTITVIFCPGRYDLQHGAVAGPEAIQFLGRFHANLAMVSAAGITERGPNDPASDLLAVKRAMLQRSEENILLLDHDKFGRKHDQNVCPLGEIDKLVCDEVPGNGLKAALRNAGVEVVC